MVCLLILVVTALLVLVVLLFHQRHHGRLTVRWWGLVLLAAFAGASFPLSVVTTLYFLIQSKFMGPYELALWITDGWRQYGRYAAVVWLVGFPLVILLKGIVFTARQDAVRSISVAILIMLPLTVIDSSLFWVGNKSEKTQRLTSISPDGLRRVTAIGTQSRDSVTYTLVCEDNVPHPWLARRLASTEINFIELLGKPLMAPVTDSSILSHVWPNYEAPHLSLLESTRLAWSPDNLVVALIDSFEKPPIAWHPLIAYDFFRKKAVIIDFDELWIGPNEELCRPIGPAIERKMEPFDRLLDEHGGLAPQPAATGSGE